MKVLVAIKRAIDFSVRPIIRADGSGVETENVKMSMNPFDEIAVEEAVRLRERGLATEVVAASIGTADSGETLRTALAMGCDRAVLVETDAVLEPLVVAKVLKALVEREGPQLVIAGKQAIDDDCGQTGQMLAALLGWPQGTFASGVQVDDGRIQVTREIDGGLETLALQLPAVVTTDLRLNEPRYATLPNVMKAKKKPLDTLGMAALGVEPRTHLAVLGLAEPPPRKPGQRVRDVAELISKLKDEARVI